MVEYSKMKESRDSIEIATEKGLIDKELVYRFLSGESYWAKGLPREIFDKSLENSLCFSAFIDAAQVGFARVITDYATFGYLADVFVLPQFRGQGISKRIMQAVTEHPDLQLLRRITLATSDAHGLYRQYGFTALAKPDIFMEKHQPGIYQKLKSINQ